MKQMTVREIQTRYKILNAVADLVRSHKIPSLPAICRHAGIRSMSIALKHAEDISRIGGSVRFKSAPGNVYFPAWYVNE